MERRPANDRLRAVDIAVGPPGSEPILCGVTVEVAAGEWLGITGENGSGKSTLALALAGLAPVRSGRVTLDGAPLHPGSPARAWVAAILQEPGSQMLCDRVLDEIALGSKNLGSAREVAHAAAGLAAERLGIWELNQPSGTLSAGRQQLVLVAAALAARPGVLVADEALAHVDDLSRERALSVLREEVASGLILVWISQCTKELLRTDRVIELSRAGVGPWTSPEQNDQTDSVVAPGVVSEIGRLRVEANARNGNRIRISAPLEIPIPRAGLVVVSGANGAGKTTLLECLTGARTVPGVEVTWSPVEPPPLGPTGDWPKPLIVGERPETQIVHEQVLEEMTYTAIARGRARAEVAAEATAMLNEFPGGSELLGRRTWSLSTGEKRLVLNISGLLAPARVLALDEPTAGLDGPRREAMANLVRRRATSIPVFVATQDQDWGSRLNGFRVDLGPLDRS